MNKHSLHVLDLGIQDYQSCLYSMQDFTNKRTDATIDQIWLVEHPAIYTQGIAGMPEHIIAPSSIPICQSDRGGQITYHGPGQLIIYTLIDLKRLNLNIRAMVTALEQITINMLSDHGIKAKNNCQAPGVYINNAKIASLGLRVRKFRCYHGLAINVAMDLTPFAAINPCGLVGQKITQLSNYVPNMNITELKKQIISHMLQYFGYNDVCFKSYVKTK